MSEKTEKNGLPGDGVPTSHREGSSSAAAEDLPPSYTSSAEEELIQPATLLLAGTTVFSDDSASSPPLYELSYPIGHLRESNTTVSFSRFEQRVRLSEQPSAFGGVEESPQQVPRVTTRKKHIYDLKRALLIHLTLPKFSYYLESLSRGNLGHIGLKTHRHRLGTAPGYRAWNTSRPRPYADLEPQETVAFAAKGRSKGRFEWRDGGSNGERRLVANEVSEGGIYRLQIVEALTRKERDALVATWCLRLWWEIAAANVEPLTWAEVKYVLQHHTGELPWSTASGKHIL